MAIPLDILQCGAVTAVGLNAPQTCAAIRAGISVFQDAYALPPPDDPVIGAVVPARLQLKLTPTEWLANLAARSIGECLQGLTATDQTALIISLPEEYRNHPAITPGGADRIVHMIQKRLEVEFRGSPILLQHGHAGALHGLELARGLLATGQVDKCVVGGVDSLLNESDVERLRAAYRIYRPDNPQALIPGEGSAFVLVSTGNRHRRSLARILGVGVARETDTVLGPRYSQGRGLQRSLTRVLQDAGLAESIISFRVSDMNGERYRAWESLLAEARFYRTPRCCLVSWYPAASVGDIGAATSALGVVTAAVGIAKGYAPGPYVMCESSSDEGLRAACLLASSGGQKQSSYY
jgi:3-oxoacyl-[acyl-carrier-protein] synthase-1